MAAETEAEFLKQTLALGPSDWWLAKVSAKVEAAADVLLADAAQLASRLQELPAVHALSLSAYSGFSSVTGADA